MTVRAADTNRPVDRTLTANRLQQPAARAEAVVAFLARAASR